MYYRDVPRDERLKYGLKDNLVRFSFGVEDSEDFKADILQALDTVPVKASSFSHQNGAVSNKKTSLWNRLATHNPFTCTNKNYTSLNVTLPYMNNIFYKRTFKQTLSHAITSWLSGLVKIY